MLLACLLFAAQLLAQVHVLHHLEDPDHDEFENEPCLLCILGTATDHAGIDSIALPPGAGNASGPGSIDLEGIIARSPIAYRGRAPPQPSPIA